MVRLAVLFFSVWFVCDRAVSQVEWCPDVDLAKRQSHAMAFDSIRQRVLLFGGGGTREGLWEWDGVGWTHRDAATVPPQRHRHAMAFDPVRGRLVVFGGQSYDGSTVTHYDDTWEWDGVSWTEVVAAQSPSARDGARMVFDAARGRVVLFGGYEYSGFQANNELWEWDGASWTMVTPAGVQPPARFDTAMAYDARRGRVVIYGGNLSSVFPLQDTWEWDGASWTEVQPATQPKLDIGPAAWFDAVTGRTMLLGSRFDVVMPPVMQTWAFDGVDWSLVASNDPTPLRPRVVLAHDEVRGRTVAYGGSTPFVALSDTWEFNGSTWSLRDFRDRPLFRSLTKPKLVYDATRGVTVMVGCSVSGPVQTWENSGSGWLRRASVGGPALEIGQSMTFDSVRSKVVLFGGQSPFGYDQTWEYDGTTWTQLSPSVRPPGIWSHGMAFDPIRQRTVVFGRVNSSGQAITWEWDGAQWIEMTPLNMPGGRYDAGMVWHPVRQTIVLYGGQASSAANPMGDMWEWDGNDWTLLDAAPPPGARAEHQMWYDDSRDRLVVHGGRDWQNPRFDTWEWDGSSWAERTTAIDPRLTSRADAAFDSLRRRAVLYGALPSLMWTYGPEFPATAERFGVGCAGTAGVPLLAPDVGSLPWLGDDYRQIVINLPTNAPSSIEIGFSDQTWNGLPLPFDMSVIGMTNCIQLISADVVVGVLADGSGRAQYDLRIPVDQALLGMPFFSQSFTVDPLANPLGGTLSNAVEMHVGGR